MKKNNPVVWFEIYVNDINRAAEFYEKVLQVTLEDMSDPTNSSRIPKRHYGNYHCP